MSEPTTNGVETTPPSGIKGVMPAENWWTPEHALFLVLPVFFALLAAWLILSWLGRQRTKKIKENHAVTDSWAALGETLKSLAVPANADESAWVMFASELSVASRKIFGEAVGINFADLTTDEFAKRDPHWTVIDGLDHASVLNLLRDTDLVRFAGRIPNHEQASAWRDQVQNWYRIQDQRRNIAESVPSSVEVKRVIS